MAKTKPIPELSESKKEIFLCKINVTDNENDCWEWHGQKDACGYGRFYLPGGLFSAHRIAYFLKNNKDAGELSVLHHCDNPACCNSSHLFLGTQTDNMKDRSNKGRGNHPFGERHGTKTKPESVARGIRNGHYTKPECMPKGERMGTAKLTNNQVLKIRELCIKGGKTYTEIAEIYKVSNAIISGIARGKGWKHLPGSEKVLKRLGGADNWTAKLTEKEVIRIRKLYSTGDYPYSKLVKKFGVNASTIACIIRGKTWKHLLPKAA